MKYLKNFWKFIVAAWKLDRSCNYHVARFNLITGRTTKKQQIEEVSIVEDGVTIARWPTSELSWEEETSEELGKRIDKDLRLLSDTPAILMLKGKGFPKDPKSKVLLHEAENCPKCGETFLSLYSFKECKDHEGQEKL